MEKIECFKIRVYKTDTLLDFEKYEKIKDVLCKKNTFFYEPRIILADPFLFVKNDTLYLFYEEKKLFHNGVISMVKTKDLKSWSKPVTVLSESCHLSYPWVFEDDGHVYMIPESCGLKEVRLYEANEDLSEFCYKKTILRDNNKYETGFSFSDSSIYKKDKSYYLFTTVNNGIDNILKLYVSDKAYSDYVEHPVSPISTDNKFARNAGCILDLSGKLYRVAQDCEKRYGDNVNLMEIQEMNPSRYKETLVKDNIIPTKIPFFKEGGHQLNVAYFKDQYIVATDAKEYHYFLTARILNKVKSLKK